MTIYSLSSQIRGMLPLGEQEFIAGLHTSEQNYLEKKEDSEPKKRRTFPKSPTQSGSSLSATTKTKQTILFGLVGGYNWDHLLVLLLITKLYTMYTQSPQSSQSGWIQASNATMPMSWKENYNSTEWGRPIQTKWSWIKV